MHDAHVQTLVSSLPERISQYYMYYEDICFVRQENLLSQVQWARKGGFLSKTAYLQAVQNSIVKSGIQECDRFFNLKKLYPEARISIFQTNSPYTLAYTVLYGGKPKEINQGHWDELEKIVGQESEIFLSKINNLVTDCITYLERKVKQDDSKKPKRAPKIAHAGSFCEEHSECFDSH